MVLPVLVLAECPAVPGINFHYNLNFLTDLVSTKRCISCQVVTLRGRNRCKFPHQVSRSSNTTNILFKTALLDPTFCGRCNSQRFQILKPGRPPSPPQVELDLLSQLGSPPSPPASPPGLPGSPEPEQEVLFCCPKRCAENFVFARIRCTPGHRQRPLQLF